MDHQHSLPNYTCTPPPHEIKDAFNSVTNQEQKTRLVRNGEMMTTPKIAADKNQHLNSHPQIMLPPTPDTSPDMSCEIESFEGQNNCIQRYEMMPSPPSPHDNKDLLDTVSEQRSQQLHRAERVPIPEMQEYDPSSVRMMDLPLCLDISREDEPQKKRPRVDSGLTLFNSLDDKDIASKSTEKNPFKAIHEVWTDEEEKTINQPYNYLTSHSGKDIRKQILAAFNVWLKVEPVSLEIINRVVGMLHNASLLIDDIQDSSPLRRGSPSAHLVYGTASTINSANYVYFQAMQTLSSLPARIIPQALQIYCEELLHLHRGQGLDLHWRDTHTLPTPSAYLKMVSNKTGGLFRLAIRLMCLVSESERSFEVEFAALVEKLGLIFQIRDDFKNLVSDVYTTQKGHCEDLTEGKFSFPIIHAIQNSAPGDTRILEILALKTEDDALKDFVVDYMRDVTKTFEHTEGVLRRLDEEAREEMKRFKEENLLLGGLLDKLAA
ncbi:terpenoid synthase [Venturia nashicola]|uniref:geranylgeranyl diphosphate synthase n=1 Tax=Venturia nashicola TaxID=86259 RepID=A0A4Z1NHH0_9PEZI|nr:terpenoid synthase [Venturia nashicola]TLD21037.1 terpenoid synthase [Venturia nashicola]